jgi:HSP20 family protein
METQKNLTERRERLPEQTRERAMVAPPVDIFENADELLVLADVPGVTRDTITIDLNKGQLTLTARRVDPEGGTTASKAWGAFDYHRAFLVPSGIDAEKITAELSNGVLSVRLPKSAALKPRRIEVKAG